MKEPRSPQELLDLNEAFHNVEMASARLRAIQRILVVAEKQFQEKLAAFRLLFEKDASVD